MRGKREGKRKGNRRRRKRRRGWKSRKGRGTCATPAASPWESPVPCSTPQGMHHQDWLNPSAGHEPMGDRVCLGITTRAIHGQGEAQKELVCGWITG